MKLSIQIAAVRRRIRRLEQDRPLFEKRIADLREEQKELAIKTFALAIEKDREELQRLLLLRD
jgi:hypothetical protein